MLLDYWATLVHYGHGLMWTDERLQRLFRRTSVHLVERKDNIRFSDKFTNDPGERSPDNTARRGTQCADREITVLLGIPGRLNDAPIPVAFISVSYDTMAHRRRQIGGSCATRKAMGLLQPRNANQRPPAQKVDLMKTVYPEEDYYRKSLTLSIVPEVDEEEEEQTTNTLSAASPHGEESPKNLKRKSSLVELVLDVASLIRLIVKGKD